MTWVEEERVCNCSVLAEEAPPSKGRAVWLSQHDRRYGESWGGFNSNTRKELSRYEHGPGVSSTDPKCKEGRIRKRSGHLCEESGTEYALAWVRGTLWWPGFRRTVESGARVSKVKSGLLGNTLGQPSLLNRSCCPIPPTRPVRVPSLPGQPFFPTDPHQPQVLPWDACISWEYLRNQITPIIYVFKQQHFCW